MIGEDIDLGLRYFDLSADLLTAENKISEVALAKLEYVVEAGTMPPGRYTVGAGSWVLRVEGSRVGVATKSTGVVIELDQPQK